MQVKSIKLSLIHFIVILLYALPNQSVGAKIDCSQPQYQGAEYVPERLLLTMQQIAEAYCAAGGKQPLTVNSGIRTAPLQARLMASCLSRQACGYYANAEAALELQSVYDSAEVNKIDAVAARIAEQMKRKEPCYISKHLTTYGLDLERWKNGRSGNCQTDLSGDDLLLSKVLNEHKGVANVVYKEASGCTHFHVNFVGWDQIPGLKSCSQ